MDKIVAILALPGVQLLGCQSSAARVRAGQYRGRLHGVRATRDCRLSSLAAHGGDTYTAMHKQLAERLATLEAQKELPLPTDFAAGA